MYRTRVVDAAVADVLTYSGGLLIEGVRACGKTETGRRHARSEVALDSGAPAVEAILAADPGLLLRGEAPRLLDEWQLEPSLWNRVRREIDVRQAKGQFILTGSSVPAEDAQRHSGAHRISRIRMRPMTLAEQGRGTGTVSLASLFKGEELPVSLDGTVSVPDALQALAHGGWPGDLEATTAQAQRHLRDYAEDIASRDLLRLDGESRRDPDRMRILLRSLARNLATEVKYATIAQDMSAAMPVKAETVAAYIGALQRLFVVETQPAWAPHLRSRAAIRTTAKLHFADPALAVAVMRASTDRLVDDLETAGLWFESQVVQHARVYAEALDGRVYHYRDSNGQEVDLIIQLDDGRWAAIEIKLGQRQLPKAQASLASFRSVVDLERVGEPSFMAVVTADGPVMTMPDGIHTFPIHALTL